MNYLTSFLIVLTFIDEANSHWYSLLIQLHEGQSWLRTYLNYTPVSAWAIDPFGHSPTMTNLLMLSGFKNMVIGRTHYVVKKHFAMHKHLEFYWRQLWGKRPVLSITSFSN